MLLKKRMEFIKHRDLTLTTSNFPVQTVKIELPRTWPLEAIFLGLRMTKNATAVTSIPDRRGIFKHIKRVTLEINDGANPRKVIDASGFGLLQYAANVGMNIPRSTAAIRAMMFGLGSPRIPASTVINYVLPIPLMPPALAGKLRPRGLLPCHLHSANPLLTVELDSGTNSINVADPYTGTSVLDCFLVQREMPKSVTDEILGDGGFLQGDIFEKSFGQSNSLADSEVRLELPTPGQLTGVQITHMRHTASGDTPANALELRTLDAVKTVGAETQWSIETAGVSLARWRSPYLQWLNDGSMMGGADLGYDASGSTLTGTIDGTWGQVSEGDILESVRDILEDESVRINNTFTHHREAGGCVQEAASVFIDNLTDDAGAPVTELGGLMDANLAANSGLKLELVGQIDTAGAGNFSSSIDVLVHRFYGDLSRFQAIK